MTRIARIYAHLVTPTQQPMDAADELSTALKRTVSPPDALQEPMLIRPECLKRPSTG